MGQTEERNQTECVEGGRDEDGASDDGKPRTIQVARTVRNIVKRLRLFVRAGQPMGPGSDGLVLAGAVGEGRAVLAAAHRQWSIRLSMRRLGFGSHGIGMSWNFECLGFCAGSASPLVRYPDRVIPAGAERHQHLARAAEPVDLHEDLAPRKIGKILTQGIEIATLQPFHFA